MTMRSFFFTGAWALSSGFAEKLFHRDADSLLGFGLASVLVGAAIGLLKPLFALARASSLIARMAA